MSKVVHLSDEAHQRAKEFCREKGIKMSDWVASLIDGAVVGVSGIRPTTNATAVPRKKPLARLEDVPPPPEEETPPWALPPFWARRAQS